MRASDSDREVVATRLRDAHAEGRLTLDEFEERLDTTYAAKTLGELALVTRDLPTPTGTDPAVPERGDEARRSVRGAWVAWGTCVVICVGIWATVALATGVWYFWPIWVAGPWGALLLARTLFGDRERPGRRGERDHR